mgnify:CR=1 FL=1
MEFRKITGINSEQKMHFLFILGLQNGCMILTKEEDNLNFFWHETVI